METGHAKIVSNFALLIQCCTDFGLVYNPVNNDIKIVSLEAKHTDGVNALSTVSQLVPPFENAINARQFLFDPFSKLITRTVNSLVACGANEKFIADIRTRARKLRGWRTKPKDPEKKISASQMSFDMRIQHFDEYIELLASEPKYAPNETDLQIVSLRALLTSMRDANSLIIELYPPLDNARKERNRILYNKVNGLVRLATLVKQYVRSLFGPDSDQYNQIKGIDFTPPGGRD